MKIINENVLYDKKEHVIRRIICETRFSMAVLYGRRRIGKSFLLSESVEEKPPHSRLKSRLCGGYFIKTYTLDFYNFHKND